MRFPSPEAVVSGTGCVNGYLEMSISLLKPNKQKSFDRWVRQRGSNSDKTSLIKKSVNDKLNEGATFYGDSEDDRLVITYSMC